MDGTGSQGHPRTQVSRRVEIWTPDEVSAMLALKARGWGAKRISAELGCSRNTVRRWLAEGGWRAPELGARPKALDGLEGWLAERFRRHAGNADVVRQELIAEKGISVSLRTVERAVAPLRQEFRAEARATVRFETRPGQQLQIDFGERRVEIGGAAVKVFFFVATLGYSRRLHVRAFTGERQEHWFEGLEGAFRRFGGVPEEVLLDNARALIVHHDPAAREVVLHPRLHAFARHWGFQVRACAPYRARTKGKDERGVGYVKRNAIAGRRFESFGALEAHLDRWVREVADVRIHGTTGEPPRLRFDRDEGGRLKPIDGVPPFQTSRELIRRVSSDCAVEVDGNAYSVPWRLIGERVSVLVAGADLHISHAGQEVACHAIRLGRHGRVVDLAHFAGLTGGPRLGLGPGPEAHAFPAPAPQLLRPLSEYEAIAGGPW
ncbi:transposase [Rubellimicrobium aerolatum]|nr:transposase [Rubellimicrobium aerolatum]